MDPQRSLWTTYAMMLTVAVIWGAAWPVGRALALAAPPWSAMALRYCFAVPLLFMWLHFAEGVRVPVDEDYGEGLPVVPDLGQGQEMGQASEDDALSQGNGDHDCLREVERGADIGDSRAIFAQS